MPDIREAHAAVSAKELERLRSVERAAQDFNARLWTTRERDSDVLVVASTESDWRKFSRVLTPKTREELLEEFYREVQSHAPGCHIGQGYCEKCGAAFDAIGEFDRGE